MERNASDQGVPTSGVGDVHDLGALVSEKRSRDESADADTSACLCIIIALLALMPCFSSEECIAYNQRFPYQVVCQILPIVVRVFRRSLALEILIQT